MTEIGLFQFGNMFPFFFLSLLGGKIKERKKKKKPVISQLLVVAWQHSLLHLCVVQR